MSHQDPTSAAQVVQQAQVDIQRELPESNPFLRNSMLRSIVIGICNRVFDAYFAINKAALEAMPHTTILNLVDWAANFKIIQKPASPSNGLVTFTGPTASGTIVSNSTLLDSDGKNYKTDGPGDLDNLAAAISTATESGGIGTYTTVSDHNITSKILVSVAGMVPNDYDFSLSLVTVTGLNTFTIAVSGSPVDATTVTTADYIGAVVSVTSVDSGLSENQDPGAILELQSVVAGVDNSVGINQGGFVGGSDAETTEAFRARFLFRLRNPNTPFNVAQITDTILSIPGNTRVFVNEVTPAVGQCEIFFMRDDDPNPIPDPIEVGIAKTAIDALLPATTDTADVFVKAPTPVPTNFTFTALSPDTNSMRNAVEDNLRSFFATRPTLAADVISEAYTAAIFNTIDVITGDRILDYATTPTADITISADEIATLGSVVFNV